MLETEMKNGLKKLLQFQPIQIVDIETGGTEVGVADLAIRTDKLDIWMESKEIKRWPVREDTKIIPAYRPGQYRFLRDYQRLNGVSVLSMTYKDMWFMVTNIKKEYTKDELAYYSFVPMDLLEQDPRFVMKLFNNLK